MNPEDPVPEYGDIQIMRKGQIVATAADHYVELLTSSSSRELEEIDANDLEWLRQILGGWKTRLDQEYNHVFSFSPSERAGARNTSWEKLAKLEREFHQSIPESPEAWNLNDIYTKLGREGLEDALVVCFCDRHLQQKIETFIDSILQ